MNRIIENEKIDAAIIVPEVEVVFWSKSKFKVPYLVPDSRFVMLQLVRKDFLNFLKTPIGFLRARSLTKICLMMSHL